jgi:diacylglycerol kinase (ATP)
MPLPLIIVNPESANGATRAAWPRIASDLRSHFGPFAIAFTDGPGQATVLAAASARKGVKFIVACGGDGTISEVANGILQSGANAELGILPSGTGGDFRRTLEIPARTSDAAHILRTGQTRSIDVGRVTFINSAGAEDNRYFLGVASFGMSVEVIDRVKNKGSDWLPGEWLRGSGSGWISGRVSFGVSMLQTAMSSPTAEVVVQLDADHERHLKVANFCIANARYFGGGMKIAPHAKLDDGYFDVVAIDDLGAVKIVTNAPRLYSGTHLSLPEVSHALARTISARPAKSGEVIMIEVDGELPGRLPATFQILPAALKVRCPA